METWKPSEWFKERLQVFHKDLQAWHMRHVEFKDPTKRAVAVLMGPTMSKSAGPPPGGALSKAKAQAPGGAESKAKPEQKDDSNGNDKKDSKEEEKDTLQQILDEMEKEDQDIFGVDDVCVSKDAEGAPLFRNFTFEDWALLSLRFELHLLVHAVRRDRGNTGGIDPKELASHYTKYYKKSLDPKNYGAESVEGIIELVKDTAIIGMRSKVVEPMVTHDLMSNGIFVKLTEDNRRDRKRKIDAGEESAQLKFPRPNAPQANSATVAKGAPVSGAPVPFENAATTPKAGGAGGDMFATTPKAKGLPPTMPGMPGMPGGWGNSAPPAKGLPPTMPGGWGNSASTPKADAGGWGNSASTPKAETGGWGNSASTPKAEAGGWNWNSSSWGSDDGWSSSPSKAEAGGWSSSGGWGNSASTPKAEAGSWPKPVGAVADGPGSVPKDGQGSVAKGDGKGGGAEPAPFSKSFTKGRPVAQPSSVQLASVGAGGTSNASAPVASVGAGGTSKASAPVGAGGTSKAPAPEMQTSQPVMPMGSSPPMGKFGGMRPSMNWGGNWGNP